MTRPNSWTPEEAVWFIENYPHVHNRDLARLHAERFPERPKRTAKAMNARARALGLHKAEDFVRNPPTFWTPEKDEWFRSFVPGHHEAEISAEHERIYGTPLTASQIGNRKAALHVRSGTDGGQFRRGQTAWNKGMSWDEQGRSAESRARSLATCFKPGEVHVAPSREREVGFERVDDDGFTWVKVRDSRVDGIQRQEPWRHNENYRLKHHLVYEQAYGSIPRGCNIVFADRDKTNFDPENLVAVPRRLWTIIQRRLDYWDAESLRTAMLVAELDSARHAAQCRPRACRKCGETFQPRYAHQRTCDACLGARGNIR